MGNYYIQSNTLNGALSAIAENTRGGHFVSAALSSYYLGVISYTASTGNTFYYCKQLTFDGNGNPNGYSTTARFDDVPADLLSYVAAVEMMVDKEFYVSVNNNAYCGVPSNFISYSKSHANETYLNIYSGGWQSRPADQNYPFTSAAISGYIYYLLVPATESQSAKVQFRHYHYKHTFVGEVGYYAYKASSLGSSVSFSGCYIRTVVGAEGLAGADGIDGLNGIDGVDGLDAPMPDLTGIETALANLSNLEKLQKYDDMLIKFDKIIKVLCRFLSWNVDDPDGLNFITVGEAQKNADNLRDLAAVVSSLKAEDEYTYPALQGAITDSLSMLTSIINKVKPEIESL